MHDPKLTPDSDQKQYKKLDPHPIKNISDIKYLVKH
jgi:hypothetical protein